jgi:hypothetical protein
MSEAWSRPNSPLEKTLNKLFWLKVGWFVSLGASESCSMFRYGSASSDTGHILRRGESGEAFGGMHWFCWRHCSLLSGDTKAPGTASSKIRALVEGRISPVGHWCWPVCRNFRSKPSSAHPNAGQSLTWGLVLSSACLGWPTLAVKLLAGHAIPQAISHVECR